MASDDERVVESDGDYDDDLVSTARVLDLIETQHRQMTKACSMAISLLEDDDDRMGDTVDGDYSVDAEQGVTDFLRNMLSGHESRFFRVVGFTIAEWEVTTCLIANELNA
jgi:hypothetical protein